jgi:hypothetical protein
MTRMRSKVVTKNNYPFLFWKKTIRNIEKTYNVKKKLRNNGGKTSCGANSRTSSESYTSFTKG